MRLRDLMLQKRRGEVAKPEYISEPVETAQDDYLPETLGATAPGTGYVTTGDKTVFVKNAERKAPDWLERDYSDRMGFMRTVMEDVGSPFDIDPEREALKSGKPGTREYNSAYAAARDERNARLQQINMIMDMFDGEAKKKAEFEERKAARAEKEEKKARDAETRRQGLIDKRNKLIAEIGEYDRFGKRFTPLGNPQEFGDYTDEDGKVHRWTNSKATHRKALMQQLEEIDGILAPAEEPVKEPAQGAAKEPEIAANNPMEVRDLYRAGKIDRETARNMLQRWMPQ